MEWNISSPKTEYYAHDTPGLDAVIREIIDTREVAIDTETTGLVNWKDVVLYWSIAWGGRRVTLNVSALPHFAEAFADPNKRWLMANAKYDTHMLANMGTHLAGELIDTQVMHSLLYEDHPHNLKYMNYHLFGWKWADFQDTFGKITKTNTPETIIRKAEQHDFNLLCEYAANDAWGTLKVYEELSKQLKRAQTHSLFRGPPFCIETLWDLFDKVEAPYTKVLWKGERNGVLIDRQYMHDIAPTAKEELEELDKEICKEAGTVLNPNSTKQLRAYFFDKLGVKPLKKTKGGKSGIKQPSVDESFLTHYENEVPMAAMLLRHRKLSKLYGTYIVGLNELIDPNGRTHPTFNQDVARTGRLSSKEPNIQQIPKPENDKWNLRGAFVASPGNRLIVGDYEQLEMRLLACAAMDEGMIEVINKGWDIHMGNASLMYNIPYEEIQAAKKTDKLVDKGELPPEALTPRMKECLKARSAAKNNGFALIYGQGIPALARALGVEEEEAAKTFAAFEATYPAAKAFKLEAIEETEQTGYAFTILGRRRNVPEIASYRRDERAKGERIAVNTQIQGSAADVVKMAQVLLDKSGIDHRYGAVPLFQVHDELAFECPEAAAEEAKSEIQEWMEHPFPIDLPVPLAVDINTGHSWMEAK